MNSRPSEPPALTALSVVLPAYKEAENLRIVLPELHAALHALGIAYEILVIDRPESDDDTQSVCAAQRVRYCTREGGEQYGAAVRTGIRHAGGEHILFMDADGSHSPRFIPALYALREAYDVVIASRYVQGGQTRNGPLLTLFSRVLNGMFALALGCVARDVSTSFKLYRGGQLRVLTLTCEHFDILQEILFKLARANPGLRIKEVPFVFEKRFHGTSKRRYGVFLLSYLTTLFKLRRMH